MCGCEGEGVGGKVCVRVSVIVDVKLRVWVGRRGCGCEGVCEGILDCVGVKVRVWVRR